MIASVCRGNLTPLQENYENQIRTRTSDTARLLIQTEDAGL